MPSYTLSATVQRPFDSVVESVREALEAHGFGVLTEIDLAGSLKQKIGVDLPPQIILGACRPPLAYEAIQADPSIAAVLPCNVVVRATGDSTTVVEAFDPQAMMGLSDTAELDTVAADARERLRGMLERLGEK